MHDDFAALFTFNRWANAKMLDACRKLTPEQYAAEPVPGWGSIRSTVYHIAVVTDGWLRTLANDPDQSFPTEAETPTIEDAARILERAYRTLDALLPTLTPEVLARSRTFSRRGRTAVLPPWVVLRHVVNHTTYHRGQVASKLKRFGIQQPETDLVYWALEQVPQQQ
ncbi:MAG TPA: DinB family protein [Gemmataceae bacterium]|nr:DinB family protein [Gemmataceae bacterium]